MNGALMLSTKFDILLYYRHLLPYRATSRQEHFALDTGRIGGVFHGLLPTQPAFIEFVGLGYGHGVSMSQWGAYGLASMERVIRPLYAAFTQV